MKIHILGVFTLLAITPFAALGGPVLGTAAEFAVLGGTTVTNTGLTMLFGSAGVSPGGAITGFPPGTLSNGVFHFSDPAALQAQIDLVSAYNAAAGSACGTSLTGQDLGGMTLNPGVYCFTSSAQMTGTLTLDALGDPNAVFIFQVGSTLTTANGSSISFLNSGVGRNVFWQVGSSATLGATTAFSGHILAQTSITMNTGASISCGSALARDGAVTLDTNSVSVCAAEIVGSEVPEPGTGWTVLLFGGGGALFLRSWRIRQAARA